MDERLRDLLEGKGENYIMPFFWQHGEEEAVLREEMEKIHKAGIRAVCVESRGHPDFCGPSWWRDMDIIMDEAKKRGMRVWLLDDAHFPTGFANGWIRDKFPQRRKKYVMEKHVDVDGPLNGASFIIDQWLNKFDWMFPDEKLFMADRLLAVVASRRCDESASDIDDTLLDLTSRIHDGMLYWDVPEGQWRIFILIETENWGGNPDYMNILDAESVRVLIDAVYEQHYKRYHKDFGGTFAGFFSDEPSFGNTKGFNFDESIGRKKMVLPWSRETEKLLEEKLGKEFKRFLPCLWQNAGNITPYVRYVYMDTITRLYEKNFAGQIGEWCKEHNVEYIGHIIEDQNVHARLGCGAGHFFRAIRGQHMAGIDIIGQQVMPRYETFKDVPPGLDLDSEFFHFGLAKMGASVAHIDPHKKGRTMCEIFGASGWACGVKLMKWLVDHALVRGVNWFVPHAFSPKEFPDPDCPPHFYARGKNPQYRYFGYLMNYANRLCHLLNGGKHVAPVAILYHAEAEWSGNYMYFQKPAHWLARNQIDYDIIPADVFENMEVFNARLESKRFIVNGEEYLCLVVPYSQRITTATAEFIGKAVQKGFEVIFLNGLPESICDEPDTAKTEQLLKGVRNCRVAKLEELSDILRQKGIYEIELTAQEPYLRYYHYNRGETDIYMFFNEHPSKGMDTIVKIPKTGKVSLYNAFDNTLTPLDVETDKNATKIRLRLSKYESAVVVFGDVDDSIRTENATKQAGVTHDDHFKEYEIKGEWKLSTASSLEYPRFSYKFIVDKLENMSAPGYLPDFAGTFRYETEFNLEDVDGRVVLDMGDVFEVAEVWVNGHHAGVRISPPYAIDISGLLKKGVNTLCIDVTNTLVREVKDWASLNVALDPSGLIGPIKIKYYKR